MNATLRLMLPALVLGLAITAANAQAAEETKAKTESVTFKIDGMT